MILTTRPTASRPAVQRLDVQGGALTIGRGADCDWTLPDPGRLLSKRHCRLQHEAQGWSVTDLSSNGMTVNGHPLAPGMPHPVRDGDWLGLGVYEIDVSLASPAAFDRPAAGLGDAPFGRDDRAGGRLLGDAFVSPGDTAMTEPFDVALPASFGAPEPGRHHADEAGHGGRGIAADDVSDLRAPFDPPRPSHSLLPDDWNAAEAASADAHAPAQAIPDWDIPDWAAPDAGIPGPGMAEPGVTRPGAPDRGVSGGGVPAEGAAGKGAADPGIADPGIADRGIADRGIADRGVLAGRVVDPGAVDRSASGPLDATDARDDAALAGPRAAEKQPLEPATSEPPLGASPPVAATSPGLASPLASSAAPTASPPTQADPASQAAFAAFARGAGLEGTPREAPERALEQLGRAFRAYVVGLRRLMIARATVKGEFRIERTMIRPFGNNPLKFAADDDDAMAALLGIGRHVGMSAEQAIGDSLRDVLMHEMALTRAVERGIQHLMAELSPAQLEADTAGGGLDGVPGVRSGRLWNAYVARHARVAAGLTDSSAGTFGLAFARAYEAAIGEGGGAGHEAADDDEDAAEGSPS